MSVWPHHATTVLSAGAVGLIAEYLHNPILGLVWLGMKPPIWAKTNNLGVETQNMGLKQIRPHQRCWGVIFRMALVKGYRFTWGGGHFSAKTSCF